MQGKYSAVLFKSLAVVSALAIGGGYVFWRQSEAEEANEKIEQVRAKKKVEEMTLMVGSKNPGRSLISQDDFHSRNDFSKPIPGIPEGSDEISNIVPLLPGSKSINMPLFSKRDIKGLEIDDGDTAEDLPPAEAEEQLPKLLPGSKSAIVIPVEPEPDLSE